MEVSEDPSNSWLISRKQLAGLRLMFCTFLYSMVVLFSVLHFMNMWTFSVENFVGMTISMTLLLICSVSDRGTGFRKYASYLAQLSLVDAVFIDVIFWTLLADGNTLHQSAVGTLCTIVYHALNAAFLIAEFALNEITLHWIVLSWAIPYLLVYVFVIEVVYHRLRHGWIYYFFNWADGPKWRFPLVIVGLLGVYLGVFSILKAILTLKLRLIKKQASERQPDEEAEMTTVQDFS